MSNDSRFTGTFEYVVETVSEMTLEQEIYSKPYMIGNLCWEIVVKKTSVDLGSPHLGVYLSCFDIQKASSWKCFANVTISMLSFTGDGQDHSWTFKRFFHPEEEIWGVPDFMEWEEILSESNGYIEKDEIIIRADVEFSFPVGFSPCENRNLHSNSTNEITTRKPINQSTVIKIVGSEKEIEFLEAQVSQLKFDLMNERCNSKKISRDLETKSEEIESLRNTIVDLEELLKAEKLESDEKLEESHLKIDSMNEKSSIEKISEEFKTKSAELESSLGAMEGKMANLEELLRTEKLETAKKLKDLSDHLEKEKTIVETYKEMFRKVFS